MNVKQVLNATLVVVALAPLAAFAEAGDEIGQQWLASLQSTRTVAEVRAEARTAQHLGEHHPVELQMATESGLSRAEVRAELAKHGVPMVGA